ncbi:MAG: thioredoxin family protein [Mycoplasmataceae bacterium]|nr:thioredoxin family protein [Mycoplasmataceae bacterium]
MIIFGNKDNLDNILSKNNKVIIDFYTDWCPPCQVFKPTFEESDKENKDITHILLDVDAYQDIAIEWGIQQIPTVISIKDNKEISRIVGVVKKEDFDKKIKELKKDEKN